MGEAKRVAVGNSPKNIGRQLRDLADAKRGEKIQVVIDRAARLAAMDYWRAYEIWYGRARQVTTEEIERVASGLEKKRREATRNELHDIKLRIAALESRLRQTDEEFHRPSIDALRLAVRRGG